MHCLFDAVPRCKAVCRWYMNWLLMVPMPVTEIVLAMELTPAEEPDTGSKLGAASALRYSVASGEWVVSGDNLRFRWTYWASSQSPSPTWSHALGGISLEAGGGDERHREVADPFRRNESPWSAD